MVLGDTFDQYRFAPVNRCPHVLSPNDLLLIFLAHGLVCVSFKKNNNHKSQIKGEYRPKYLSNNPGQTFFIFIGNLHDFPLMCTS